MHCLAPNCNGDGTGCDNMTCIIVTFKPYKTTTLSLQQQTGETKSQENDVTSSDTVTTADETALNSKLNLKRALNGDDKEEKQVNGDTNDELKSSKKAKFNDVNA